MRKEGKERKRDIRNERGAAVRGTEGGREGRVCDAWMIEAKGKEGDNKAKGGKGADKGV